MIFSLLPLRIILTPRVVVDRTPRYAGDEDEESELEEYMQEILDEGGDAAMVRFCELVCEKMADPGVTRIEGVLKLATTVASDDDVTAEHWKAALVAGLGNLPNVSVRRQVVSERRPFYLMHCSCTTGFWPCAVCV
jgi:hypothetical protein